MLRAAVCLILAAGPAVAADTVPVGGSDIVYPRTQTLDAGGKPVSVTATGTALRKKLFFNVYTIASYLQTGTAAGSAEDVAGAEAVRLLHLVMERDVDGETFLSAIRSAVTKAHGSKFDAELKTLAGAVGTVTAKKGDNVYMTYAPGTGFRVRVADKADVTIPGAGFAKAVWDIYLGADPIDADIKRDLVSRLGK